MTSAPTSRRGILLGLYGEAFVRALAARQTAVLREPDAPPVVQLLGFGSAPIVVDDLAIAPLERVAFDVTTHADEHQTFAPIGRLRPQRVTFRLSAAALTAAPSGFAPAALLDAPLHLRVEMGGTVFEFDVLATSATLVEPIDGLLSLDVTGHVHGRMTIAGTDARTLDRVAAQVDPGRRRGIRLVGSLNNDGEE